MTCRDMKVPMERGGEMPMFVDFDAKFSNEPDYYGWEIEVNSVRFSESDTKERIYTVDFDRLKEKLAELVESESKEYGWKPPRQVSAYY